MSLLRWLAPLAASALMATGCAPTSAYVSARQIESGASQFVDVAADTWHGFSHARLENIKDSCGDLECFKTVSAQWESGTVAPVDKAIAAARDAVKAFDKALSAADAVQQKDFSAAIQSLIQSLTALYTILNGYGVNVAAFVAKVL